MKVQWIGKNVKLELLIEEIEVFLVNRGFKVSKEVSNSKTLFLAIKKINNNSLILSVTVEGTPDNFFVDIQPKSPSRSMVIFSQFLGILGLGAFVLRKIELQEIYNKLEMDFISYLDKIVSSLENSATN